MSCAAKIISIQARSALATTTLALHVNRSSSKLFRRSLIGVSFENSFLEDGVVRHMLSRSHSSCSSSQKEKDTSTLGLDSDTMTSIDEDDIEMEDMWVDPDPGLNLDVNMKEHGGPRRGGRFLEPTRFGDWERKSRCSDF
jgi:hypothetical protein